MSERSGFSFGVPQDASSQQAYRQARSALRLMRQLGFEPASGPWVLDLCCGLGSQARVLARAGCRVVGVDIRCDDRTRQGWARISAQTDGAARFTVADVRRLPLRRRFSVATLFYNTLTLFVHNDDALALFAEVRRAIQRHGVFLIHNCCRLFWREISSGRYASGVSEDGRWQMVWLVGRNVFSLRFDATGEGRFGRGGAMLCRAWSVDELDLLCRLTGWWLDSSTADRGFLVARPC